MADQSRQVTVTQLLVPMVMMAFTLLVLFAFQFFQITRDKENLEKTIMQQAETVRQSEALNNQFGGLVMGTRKLAREGNKSAQAQEEQLKQLGVIPPEQSDATPTPAPVPAAHEPSPPSGPVKP